MAVKKVTAKKSAAKKKPAKKATAKRSAAKKSPARKSAVKKSVVKKTTAKKSAKKKSVAKNSASRKKSTAKKSSARGTKFSVPPVPIGSVSRSSRIDVGTTPTPKGALTSKVSPAKKDGNSNRVVIAVAIGVALLLLIVWGKSTGSDDEAATPAPSIPAVESTTQAPEPTESASETTVSAVEAPGGVVAHYYKATGTTTIFWKAPMAVDGLTGYSVEASANSGEWTMLSTVPATQLSLDITKGESSSTDWTSFRVSSVYADSQIASAKPFGLPGMYS